MGNTLPRHCLVCGALTRGKPRCPACEPHRGTIYGSRHVAMRKYLLAVLRANGGGSCAICGTALALDGKGVDLDHTAGTTDTTGTGPVQLTCSRCNSAKGGRRGATYTPVRKP